MEHHVDPISELDRQVQRGSMFTQAVLQRTSQRLSETEAILARVIDHLAARDLVDPEALGLVSEEPAAARRRNVPASTIPWPAVALREDDPGPSEPPELVDCEARMPVCQAVCCRLKFPLSAPEVDQGLVKWDIGHPYLIRHESDGWCSHIDRGSQGLHRLRAPPHGVPHLQLRGRLEDLGGLRSR